MIAKNNHLALIAGLGSLALLLGAWGFQYIGGLAPCPMCLWQRWPHALAAFLGGMAYVAPPLRLWSGLGVLTSAVATGLALFHSGVERQWWEGPSTCTAGNFDGLSTEELMAQIMSAPMVRCDEIAWELLGLTMPNYNALLSAALLGLWVLVFLRAGRA